MKGLESGSSLYQRLMEPKLRRETNQQDWMKHLNNLEIDKMQQERLKALMPYQIAQFQQQAAMHPLELAYKQASIQKAIADAENARLENDPAAQMAMLGSMINGFGGGNNVAPPTAPTGEQMGLGGQSAPIQEGLPQSAPEGQFGAPVTPEMIRNAFIKKKFGVDLTPKERKETPEEKRAADLETHRLKKQIDREEKSETDLTNPVRATIANNQAVIAASNNIIPQIQELKHMKIPNQLVNMYPDQNAMYLG